MQIVSNLMQLMTIKSYGKCSNNADQTLEAGCEQFSRYERKLCLMKQFKFYLAFENAVDDSWVTEKFYHGNCDDCLQNSSLCANYSNLFWDGQLEKFFPRE
jgi:hypothetical protein